MHNFILANGDTDSIAFKKHDEKPFSKEERAALLAEINSIYPDLIRWDDDDYYKKFVVVKAKNYVLQSENGKVKIKGSALKASMKEAALKVFVREVIDLLLADRKDRIYSLYMSYAKRIDTLTDIQDWCSKKTVTSKVMNNERTNERKIRDAIGNTPVQEGDKIFVFYKTPEDLCLREHFDGKFDKGTLLNKLYDTVSIFETILDTNMIPNLTLKRNQDLI